MEESIGHGYFIGTSAPVVVSQRCDVPVVTKSNLQMIGFKTEACNKRILYSVPGPKSGDKIIQMSPRFERQHSRIEYPNVGLIYVILLLRKIVKREIRLFI